MTSKIATRRAGLLLGVAAVLLGSALLAPSSALADAAPGTITLTPDSGTDDTAPIMYAGEFGCPAGSREPGASLSLVLPDGTLTNIGASTGPIDQPPSGSLDSSIGNIASGNSLTTGDYQIEFACYGPEPDFAVFVADAATMHIDVDAHTWNVVGATPPGGAVTTTTTLAAAPTTATQGDAVALTATVTGDGAAGQVEFDNGTTVLGTVDVASGQASTSVTDLPVGDNQLTAKFTPTDATAFTASTSDPVTVTVSAAGGGGGTGGAPGGQETINVTVPGDGGSSDFTLTVDPTPVTLKVSGSTATGSLSPVTVTDQRTDAPGWVVSGQSSDFANSTSSIPASNLGWVPAIDGDTHDAGPGDRVDPGDTGLSAPATLASAAAGAGQGATTIGAALTLSIPAATPPGAYSSTLTLTTMTAGVS